MNQATISELEASEASQGRSGLQVLLHPRSIVVVGASATPSKVGGKLLLHARKAGFAGPLLAVNPGETRIGDIACYPNVEALPEPVDLAVICVPAAQLPEVLHSCGRRGVGSAIVLSSGFAETGSEGAARQEQLAIIARRYGIRLLGPNCLGLFSAWNRAVLSFSSVFEGQAPQPGSLSLVAQSGALAASILAYICDAGLGLGHWVTTGNEADVTWLEVAEALVEDPRCQLLVIYAETLHDGERLLRLGRRAALLEKPLLVMTAGRREESRQAILSHTGSLAASGLLTRGLLRQGRLVEVSEPSEIPQLAQLFLQRRPWRGGGVGILSTSGGAGILMVDSCAERGLPLARLREGTERRLAEVLPAFASRHNPVDITAALMYQPAALRAAAGILAEDPEVAALVLLLTLITGDQAEVLAEELASFVETSRKPVLIVWLAGGLAASGYSVLRRQGIPLFTSIGEAASALAQLRQISAPLPPRPAAPAPQRLALAPDGPLLTESDAKALLAGYGVASPPGACVTSFAAARREASRLGVAVAVKSESKALLHRASGGGLRLGVRGERALRKACREVAAAARAAGDLAPRQPMRIEAMVSARGMELLAGGRRDPVLGTCLVVGQGGSDVEAAADVAARLVPITEAEARDLLQELRCWPQLRDLLEGETALARLTAALVRISWLLRDLGPRLSEMDVNPLLVQPSGEVLALDALILLKGAGELEHG